MRINVWVINKYTINNFNGNFGCINSFMGYNESISIDVDFQSSRSIKLTVSHCVNSGSRIKHFDVFDVCCL